MKKRKVIDDDDISFESPKLSAKEREDAFVALREYRRECEAKRTPETKLRTDLRQLKYLMEDYIETAEFDGKMGFGYFLRKYIQRIHKENSEFADEINIHPNELNQFIQKQKEPSASFLIRLEIHSNKIFPALMWHKIFSKEKSLDLLNPELRGDEEKQVKKRLSVSF